MCQVLFRRLGAAIFRRVHQPIAQTTQQPKNIQNSNLAIKRPQNEENQFIFVIYDLRFVILEIFRVF